MKFVNKSQDYSGFSQYLARGNSFKFPTSALAENQKKISGTKRDMRKKFIKSARPTYTNNRIVNRAQNGTKFLEFEPVNLPGLQENYTTPEIAEILSKKPNQEFEYLDNFASVEELLGLTQQEESMDIVNNLELENNIITKSNNTQSGFNIDSAVNYLTAHAHRSTTGYCAKYVRQALEAGGINTKDHPNSAADYVGYMPKFGFNLLFKGYGDKLPKDYTPQKGDIVVIGRVGKHKHGHIAMYNGEQWISDFKQKSFKIYDTIKDYTIWRHK